MNAIDDNAVPMCAIEDMIENVIERVRGAKQTILLERRGVRGRFAVRSRRV
jgi:hypothetical protein